MTKFHNLSFCQTKNRESLPKVIVLAFSKIGSREANAVQQAAMFRAICRVSGGALGVFLYPAGALIGWNTCGFWRRSIVLVPAFPIRRLTLFVYKIMILCVGRRGRGDVVYTRSPVFAQYAMSRGFSAILELHAVPDINSRDYENVAYAWSHPKLRRIVAISRALADDLVAEYGPPHLGSDILVAHDGAVAGPRPGPSTAHDGPLRVGYFGHLYSGKGMETIVALAPLLPDMQFEVYGGTEDDIARWRVACAGQHNLTLHGYIPHAEVAEKMTGCDMLIAPYSTRVSHVGRGDIGRWMSPLKLFEYMSAERPIVTADLPVLREVVRDGETALLCSPDDAEAFALALRHLAANPGLRTRLGSAGRDLLEEEYTWEKRARRILDGTVAVVNE